MRTVIDTMDLWEMRVALDNRVRFHLFRKYTPSASHVPTKTFISGTSRSSILPRISRRGSPSRESTCNRFLISGRTPRSSVAINEAMRLHSQKSQSMLADVEQVGGLILSPA